jgi:amino-acid N-acetyltransferase
VNAFHREAAESTTRVRRARPEDWGAIAELLKESALPLAGARSRIGSFHVGERGTAVVGCAGLERYGTAALLRSVAVTATARGGGVGRMLVERVLADAKATGITTLVLLTTTAEDYFPRFGFRRTTRQEVPQALLASDEFRSACPASAVVMRCDLAPDANAR